MLLIKKGIMTYTTKDGVKVVLQPKDRKEPTLCNGCYFSELGALGRCSLPDDGSVPEDISLGCFKSVNLSIWVKAPEQDVTTDSNPLSIPQGRAPGVDSQVASESALKSASQESHSCQACTHLGNINEKVLILELDLLALQDEIAAYKKQLGLMEAPEETNPLSIPHPGARVEAVSPEAKPKVITNEEHYGCKSFDPESNMTISGKTCDKQCNGLDCNDCRLLDVHEGDQCDGPECYDIWDKSPYGMPLDKRIPYEGPTN